METEREPSTAPHPLLVVLSGPSGVGKDAVLSRMRELKKPYHFTVTATTRPKRPTERHGMDYIFISHEAFNCMIQQGDLLEWAEVYGNLYGVPKAKVVEAMKNGLDVIVKIDVQGAATIKRLAPEALFIFLAPSDMEELTRRLRQRMTESSAVLRQRLKTAESEIRESHKFDYVVVNAEDCLDDAVDEIVSIISRERQRIPARRASL